jgi:DNA-binding CsgD family transcriptional regulator
MTNLAPHILIVDGRGKILYCSSFAAEFMGYCDIEMVNKPLRAILDGDQTDTLMTFFRKNLSERFIDLKLKFQHCRKQFMNIASQVYIDDTGYFRSGRLMVIVFRNAAEKYVLQQDEIEQVSARELLLEVKKLRHSFSSFADDSVDDDRYCPAIRVEDYRLTNREKSVLTLFLERKNAKEIAYELGLAEITIRKYLTSLYRKFGVSCRDDLFILLHGKNIV